MQEMDGRSLLDDLNHPAVEWMNLRLHAEDRAGVQQAIDRAIAAKEPFQLEHRVKRADGSTGWTFSRAVPIVDGEGRITEWFGCASDVTERVRTNEHLRLVINELNHRVKNMLAMVQAIAMRTFRDAPDLVAAQERFAARLVALGAANDLLTGDRWAGASLSHAVRQAVTPHQQQAERCRIEGPDIRISPKTALALALAMHELSTNAVKYGAWSTEKGTVEIHWRVLGEAGGDRQLEIVWSERDGPAVSPPAKRGFGSRLIERGLAGEMNAEVDDAFRPQGFAVCHQSAAYVRIQGLSVGRRILLVEDEMTVAFMIEDMLLELGHSVVDVAMRLPAALQSAATLEFDFAFLDINLDGYKTFPVAEILIGRNIPFVFATGYGPSGLDGRFRNRPVLVKPFLKADVERMLASLT